MKPLSQLFIDRICSVFGDPGRSWLEDLPSLRAGLIERWSLKQLRPVPEFSYNYLEFAQTASGKQVVLKIGVPNPELATEIKTLAYYQGRGLVRLLDADPNHGALLLERILPGTTLNESANDDLATNVAAETISRVLKPAPPGGEFPSILDWCRGYARYRASFPDQAGPLRIELIERAESLAQELLKDNQPTYLLHGDLHHNNLLLGPNGAWILIDPKGLIGEAAFEAGSYLYNPIPDLLQHPNPGKLLKRRLAILHQGTGLDLYRLTAWGYCRCVLSAIWSIEDQQETHQHTVFIAELLGKLI